MERIRKWLHDKLGWGYYNGEIVGGDSFQPTYGCRFCDGELTYDSQGNLFHLSGRKK